MEPLPVVGRILIFVGSAIVALGLILTFAERIPFLGRLPGDLVVRRGTFTFYFPLATCIILSVVLTFLFWLLRR